MTSLRLRVDRDAALPASAQLDVQFRNAIEAGRLAPGERLPTVRALAGRLKIAPNTVAKTYRGLEADGYVEGRGRAGTFVVDSPPMRDGDPDAELREAAAAFARRAHGLGFGIDEAVRAVRRTAS